LHFQEEDNSPRAITRAGRTEKVWWWRPHLRHIKLIHMMWWLNRMPPTKSKNYAVGVMIKGTRNDEHMPTEPSFPTTKSLNRIWHYPRLHNPATTANTVYSTRTMYRTQALFLSMSCKRNCIVDPADGLNPIRKRGSNQHQHH
jgi:hypothetical protein